MKYLKYYITSAFLAALFLVNAVRSESILCMMESLACNGEKSRIVSKVEYDAAGAEAQDLATLGFEAGFREAH